MSHIRAHWTESPPSAAHPNTVYNGPVVNVTAGDHARIAWGNRGVDQSGTSSAISPGYESLAAAVTKALELLSSSDDIDSDDRELAEQTANEVLTEVSNTAPDRSLLRRGLMTLRGLLGSAATAAASETGRSLMSSLVLPPGS